MNNEYEPWQFLCGAPHAPSLAGLKRKGHDYLPHCNVLQPATFYATIIYTTIIMSYRIILPGLVVGIECRARSGA